MSLGVNLLAALVRAWRARWTRISTSRSSRCTITARSTRRPAPPCCWARPPRRGRGVTLQEAGVFTRHGHTGARKPGDIGFATLRGGTVVGDHNVIFAGAGERIELGHKAEDRGIFARGALAAARWARGRKPGLYSMTDVLGLTDF